MAHVIKAKKAYSSRPLKSSAPLGAALAYLGIEHSLALLHGSQGCASFSLMLAMRHLDDNLSIQSTALNEVTTVLGGQASLEEALLTVAKNAQPKFIGVASTSLVETSGEDWIAHLRAIEKSRSRELGGIAIAAATTPDFDGAIEEGWSAAVRGIIEALVTGPLPRAPGQIDILPGVHQTEAELAELRSYCAHFGLTACIVPQLSSVARSAAPEAHENIKLGGARLPDVARLGAAVHTVALGEHMRGPAELLFERAQVPYTVLRDWTGLAGCDALVRVLTEISGVAAPETLREQRARLLDAYLDAQFWFAGKRIAIASDPDLLYALSQTFAALGANIVSAVASTGRSTILESVPAERVLVSDLDDFEAEAREHKAELLVTHSHGRSAAEHLGIPLFRAGFPLFDRLGVQDRCWIGYGGTRRLVYELANILQDAASDHPPPPSRVKTP